MKKGLLLSIVASTVLFAGGDIAPVQPVAEAPAATSDFSGAAGAGFIYAKTGAASSATYGAVAILGVSKEIFSGVTLTAGVQGGAFQTYNIATSTRGAVLEAGGLTDLNLGYSFCNTAIMVGRFSVSSALSPLINTTSGHFGLKRNTYEGVMVANTDMPDTTLWAAFVSTAVHHANTWDGLLTAPASFTGPSVRTPLAVVAGGFQNKSFADTTITAAAYYDAAAAGSARALAWKFAAAGSIDHTFCDTDLSAGAAYMKWDAGQSDYLVGGSVTQHFGDSNIKLIGTYGNMALAKYTNDTNHAFGVAGGAKTWAFGGTVSTAVSGFALGAFANYRQDKTYQVGTSIGKTYAGVAYAADYRLNYDGPTAVTSHRVRASAVYSF